jgi:hypothetical protein
VTITSTNIPGFAIRPDRTGGARRRMRFWRPRVPHFVDLVKVSDVVEPYLTRRMRVMSVPRIDLVERFSRMIFGGPSRRPDPSW